MTLLDLQMCSHARQGLGLPVRWQDWPGIIGHHRQDYESRYPSSWSPLRDSIHLGDSRDDHHFLWEGFSIGNVSTLFVSVNH